MEICGDMLLGKMKLENAVFADGTYTISPEGRMRVPTSWREKGTYTLRVNCEGEGGTVQAFATRGFEVIGEAELVPGENQRSIHAGGRRQILHAPDSERRK